ncbi:MAG: hypothetical protein SPL30_05880 [Succinivibrio sp.]|nr:hypothetical protein [Succinivibrio sp.]
MFGHEGYEAADLLWDVAAYGFSAILAVAFTGGGIWLAITLWHAIKRAVKDV